MSAAKVRIIVALLLASFAFQAGLFITSKSSTWDETHYLGIGKYLLTHRQWDVKGAIIHAPLSYYLGSIPFLFFKDDDRLWKKSPVPDDVDFLGSADILRGQAILSSPENTGDRLLQQTRIPFVLLGMLLGYLVFRFSSELYGTKSGIISLIFYSFCPNMIALSSLAVPDLPLTLFTFMLFYFLWRGFYAGDRRAHWLSGLALGLALLSKYTALLLIPAGLVVCLIQPKEMRKKVFSTVLVVSAVASIILLSGYFFDITPYLLGIKLQMNSSQIADVFLLGENSTSGWWYYYFVIFPLKTPLPVLLLFIFASVLAYRKRGNERRGLLVLVIPIIAFFSFFCILPKCSVLRYILPIYPFIFVMIGSIAAYWERMRVLISALALWHLISTISIAPHYLAYFNELAGGPGNGYKYLVDSNIDWGQDLKGLKEYMDRNRIKRVSLSYFGSDSPERYGITYDWLPSFFLENKHPERAPRLDPDQPLAISVTNLQGTHLEDKEQFKWLLEYKPVAKIGYSIYVYDLSSVIKRP